MSTHPWAWVVGLLAAGGPCRAADPARFEVDAKINVPYRADKAADPERHKLDIYLPKGKKDFPVLFFVHGGSWKSGNKGMYAPIGTVFAQNGIGAVVINYRLSPAVKHPAHIEDVAKAFAWTAENIGKHGGRADQVFVCGHSAGGHLVALLATDDKYLKAEKHSPAEIRGVVGLSGVYDIQPKVPVFQAAFGKDEAVCKAASPLTHAAGKHPPFLLMYGDKDFPTLDQMAEDMGAALKKANCDAKTVKVPDRNHFSIIINVMRDSDPVTVAVREFVEKHSAEQAK